MMTNKFHKSIATGRGSGCCLQRFVSPRHHSSTAPPRKSSNDLPSRSTSSSETVFSSETACSNLLARVIIAQPLLLANPQTTCHLGQLAPRKLSSARKQPAPISSLCTGQAHSTSRHKQSWRRNAMRTKLRIEARRQDQPGLTASNGPSNPKILPF